MIQIQDGVRDFQHTLTSFVARCKAFREVTQIPDGYEALERDFNIDSYYSHGKHCTLGVVIHAGRLVDVWQPTDAEAQAMSHDLRKKTRHC